MPGVSQVVASKWRRRNGKEMEKNGNKNSGERITNARKAFWKTPQFSAIGLVLMLIFSQHATYGLDAAMGAQDEADLDNTIYNIAPDILRWNDFASLS